ncbi:MAG: flagellar assembly peptidoglycan hydrolase FlgJ [Methylophaga sp.]|nr:flagellar assembly peptidoglycan hydrolase FlgJ [Methylophaga sp.]
MALNTHIAQTSVDFKGLAELRRSANTDQNDQETLEQVAGQFESIFVGMMLKSMRDASSSLAEGLFDSEQSNMYRDMSDQQLAIDMSAKGLLGLKDIIVRQLGGEPDSKPTPSDDTHSGNMHTVTVRPTLQPMENPALLQQIIQAKPIASVQPVAISNELTFDSPESFVQQLLPLAKQAADKIGITAEAILSQAALETGWGQHVIKNADGSSSHSLFNIKADSRWQGERTVTGTVEYRDGVAVKEQAHFRTYESYQDSFNDYVDFLQTQPRYQDALKHVDNPEKFIEGLHKAGYATDPAYADKIKRIMNSSTVAQFSQQLKHS